MNLESTVYFENFSMETFIFLVSELIPSCYKAKDFYWPFIEFKKASLFWKFSTLTPYFVNLKRISLTLQTSKSSHFTTIEIPSLPILQIWKWTSSFYKSKNRHPHFVGFKTNFFILHLIFVNFKFNPRILQISNFLLIFY